MILCTPTQRKREFLFPIAVRVPKKGPIETSVGPKILMRQEQGTEIRTGKCVHFCVRPLYLRATAPNARIKQPFVEHHDSHRTTHVM